MSIGWGEAGDGEKGLGSVELVRRKTDINLFVSMVRLERNNNPEEKKYLIKNVINTIFFY